MIFANGYLFDQAASEDVVQETYIYLWENIDKINIETSVKAYLYTMVRNRCYNFLKSIKITDDAKYLDLNASLISNQNLELFSEEDTDIVYNQILKIVDSLPIKMQEIFKLKFFSNYKYSEIADELGISVNTVKTQLKRAKSKINESLTCILILLSTGI